MTEYFLAAAAFLLTALPAAAQASVKSLTPPEVLIPAITIRFTATLLHGGNTFLTSTAVLAQPNKAYMVDTTTFEGIVLIQAFYISDGKTEVYEEKGNGPRDSVHKRKAPGLLLEINAPTFALSSIAMFLLPDGMTPFTLQKKSASDPVGFSSYQETIDQGPHGEKATLVVNDQTGLPVRITFFGTIHSKTKSPDVIEFTQ